MGLVWLILIAIGMYLAFVVYAVRDGTKRERQMHEAITSLSEFACAARFVDGRGVTGIAIDNLNGKLCFLGRGAQGIETSIVYANSIVTADILQDGAMVSVNSGGGGGIIMLGRVGVPVGARPNQVTTERVTQLELRVVVNDPDCPIRSVSFLAYPTSRTSATYEVARNAAHEWLARIDVMLRRARTATASELSSPAFSVADEIRKLALLKADGLMSEAEFERQRAKLLA